jgi:hypothetical protein
VYGLCDTAASVLEAGLHSLYGGLATPHALSKHGVTRKTLSLTS